MLLIIELSDISRMSAISTYCVTTATYSMQTETTRYLFKIVNDLIPFIRGERVQYLTPIKAPAEQKYHPKWPILELGAEGYIDSPPPLLFKGLGGEQSLYLLSFSFPFCLQHQTIILQ